MKKYLLLSLFSVLGSGFELCHDHLVSEDNKPFEIRDVQLSTSDGKLSPGDELEVMTHLKALRKITNGRVEVTLGMYGIEIMSKEISLCHPEEQKNEFYSLTKGDCVIEAGEEMRINEVFTLEEEVPYNFKLDVTVKAVHHPHTTCAKDNMKVEPKTQGKFGSKFGFSRDDTIFLFEKWFKQFESLIHLPELSESEETIEELLRKPARKLTFKHNLVRIAAHNGDKRETYKMAMNQFSHLTSEEFKKIYASGMRPELARGCSKTQKSGNLDVPKEVNWVKEGAVTEVKNQGACGSCWSFATTGSLEGALYLKTGKLTSLSEQQLVSCDHVDLGCNGGAMDNAFQFIEENNGICSEATFPYTAGEGVRGFCNVTCDPVEGSKVREIIDVDRDDEPSLLAAVSKNPVAVAIEADEASFQFYSSGVLTAACSQKLDHGVLVVGYGTEPASATTEATDYWLVKNSWGPMWGLEGYIKLERGVELEQGGECGILLGPSYPIL